MLTNRYTALSAADASIDETSAAIPAAQVFNASLQAVVTGTSTGTLKFQMSNDQPGPLTSTGAPKPTNWTDIASQTVAIAGANTYIIPKFDVCYEWLRVVFVHTNSASGTITVNVKTNGA